MLLIDILKSSTEKYGDHPALVMKMGYRTISLSYREVYEWSKKVAVFLAKQGLERGDKVLLLAPNSPYWVCVWWGSMLGGYVPVPLNVQSTGEMVKKIADQTEAKIIFKHLHWKQDLPPRLKVYDLDFLSEYVADADVAKFEQPEMSEDDIAELMYTSGTTGDPKGVMLTHKNILSNLEVLIQLAPLSMRDTFLSILPLSHIFEQVAGFLLPYAKGVSIVYAHSPAVIRDLLKEHHITIMAGVPEFLRVVMRKIESRAAEEGRGKILAMMFALSRMLPFKFLQRLLFRPVLKQFGGRLHTVISGGAPLDPELEKKWNALGVYLLQGYGLTETSPVVATNSYQDHRIGAVGKVIPGVEVKLADDGEIWVKGPNVFRGYLKNEEKTKESFTSEGWFMTGDIGELDQDGFLYIKGRKKYMIKGPGAQNVYPEDIEFELNKISGVKDSCVVGLEKNGGQVEIRAVLLLDKDRPAKPDEAVREANSALASYQRVQGWSVWPEDDFPRSATRKVKKEEVLKWLRVKGESSSAKASADVKAMADKSEGEKKPPLMKLLAEITDHDISQISEGTKVVPELGLDSLLRVELVSRIEEKFGVTIDEAKIDSETTVSAIEGMMMKQEPIQKMPPLKRWPRSKFITWDRTIDQQFLIFPLTRLFMKLRVEGKENLDNLSLPTIFMPNHMSYLDSLAVLMALPPKMRKRTAFAAAQDVLYGLYKKWAWLAEYYFNTFPFPRQEHENIKAGLEYMGNLLDDQWSIVVYPEGRMSVDGKLLPLKRGAGLIAVEMDSQVVPIKISGTAEIMPYGKIFPRKRGVVTVTFGKPMKYKRSDSYIAATEKIQKALENV
jgi:long-chain acyl-CoA synthetase